MIEIISNVGFILLFILSVLFLGCVALLQKEKDVKVLTRLYAIYYC